MTKLLFILSWKKFWRSISLGKNILITLMKGFMFLYLSFTFLFLGYFLDKILDELKPGSDVLVLVNSFVLFYLILDLLIRVLFVPSPKMDLGELLGLPIKRRELVNYYLFRSIFNFNNLAPVLFLLPFCVTFLIPERGWFYSISWAFTILLLSLSSHFVSLFLNKFHLKKPIPGAILIGILVLLIWLDFKNGLFLANLFGSLFDPFITNGLGLIFGFCALLGSLMVSYRYLFKNAYLDKGISNEIASLRLPEFSFLRRFGGLGQMIKLDLHLIFRNSRPRTALIFGVLVIPFFFYNLLSQGDFWSEGFGLIFMSIFFLGVFQLNYNQYLFSWDSSYFDFVLTGSFKVADYLMSKYLITIIFTCIAFLLMLPFCFFYPQFFEYFLMGFLLNIGVIAYIYIFIMSYNRKRIDLTKGALFNYEGSGYIQYFLAIPVLGFPFLIYAPFYYLGMEQTGLYSLMGFGVLGLALNKPIFKILVRQFNSQKYKMAAGFRKK